MSQHKPTPWEEELKRLRRLDEILEKKVKQVIKIRKKNRAKGKSEDEARFSCPICDNSVKEDIVRLRPDFYNCKKCGGNFIKENVIDDLDLDYMMYEDDKKEKPNGKHKRKGDFGGDFPS